MVEHLRRKLHFSKFAMPQRKEARTYRVRQLPCNLIYRQQVASFLVRIFAELQAEEVNVQVFSVAPSLNPLVMPPTRIATVMFSPTPLVFDDDSSEWVITGSSVGIREDVIVDVHFQGFTPLNDVSQDGHTMEYVVPSLFLTLGAGKFDKWTFLKLHRNLRLGQPSFWLVEGAWTALQLHVASRSTS